MNLLIALLIAVILILCVAVVVMLRRKNDTLEFVQIQALREAIIEKLAENKQAQSEQQRDLNAKTNADLQAQSKRLIDELHQFRNRFDSRQEETRHALQNSLHQYMKEISDKIEGRLSGGLDKTNEVIKDVIKRLAVIDEAQKGLRELSGDVIGLKNIFSDKNARGAFGEVQLHDLLRNVLPDKSFALQYRLSSGARADCVLLLPEPSGKIAIDAKFPLENYRQFCREELTAAQRQTALTAFKNDIKKHIKDIAEKYIVSGETADSAMMFIPAEAIFAEIHGRHPDLVETAQRARVWMVSPTTMMAVLTTARAVLKDAEMNEKMHLVQEHLNKLGQEFPRLGERMEKLQTHIKMAYKDVAQVSTTTGKLIKKFDKIKQVELEEPGQTFLQSQDG